MCIRGRHVALDLADDGDQDQYKQRDQRTAAGQRDNRGDGQRDRGADDRDEGREEDQQGQRHAQPQQRQADQQGVRCGDDDDAPGVPGESLPSSPTGDVDLGPHGAWSLPEEPGPHPVTAVDEEDRAEHREREPGEYLQGEAGLAQRLAYQGRLMPRDPQPGLVHRPAELRRAQVQRSPTQPLVDLVDPVAQLGTEGRGLAGVVFVAGVFAFIATSVAGQSATLSAQLSNGVNEIDQWLRRGPLHLSSSQLSGAVDQARLWISGHQAALIGQALGQASFALEVLTGFALAVFCSIFFIHSGDRMWAWFLRETPRTMRAKVDIAGRAAWETFAGYTRGIVIVAATNALLVCLALLGLRVPLALPLALLVFFATFIPIIGAPIALAVATVVALAGRGPLVALLVLVLIAVIGQIEGHVLQPLVMSRAVAIHPIVVALAVGCGTVLAGLVGAIIAVPLVSVAWSVNRKLRPIED